MGELMPLGKAFAIIAVMTHGPNLPTELSQHNERHSIFMAAAQYALSAEDITTVLAHPDADEKRIYYHNLITTSCRPLNTLLYNEARGDRFKKSHTVFCPTPPKRTGSKGHAEERATIDKV